MLDSLRRRLRSMHSLWEDAVASMDIDQVNHFERDGVLPIAFSLFHFAQIEDGSATMLGAGPLVFNREWAERIGLAIVDNGKERPVADMVHQRIGDYGAFKQYMAAVFAKTETWLADVDPESMLEIVVPRPLPENIANTFSARVAGPEGLTRLDATECWVYQHGLRHMGEIEHARALVGLQGMTS